MGFAYRAWGGHLPYGNSLVCIFPRNHRSTVPAWSNEQRAQVSFESILLSEVVLCCPCRGFQLFALLTLTALPFWVMIIGTSGFFGEYSYELGNSEVGIPYMQPYSFNNKNSAVSVLPALNFGSILEDKGSFDMTSKMKYEGTAFITGSELGRDYFLWSALCIVLGHWKQMLAS